MKKRITKSQLGKLVEAQVHQLLGEGQNINKAAKFSTALAKNVEDYCRYGLEEKILKQVKKALSEEVNYDYDGKWVEYVRNEVYNLYELEKKVPYSYRSTIHSARIELEGILDTQKRNREFIDWNN